MTSKIHNCSIQYKDIETNKVTSELLSNDDSVLVIDMHQRNKFLTGPLFTALCSYIPEIFISIDLNGTNHRYEFCLDCGQGKYFKNNVEVSSSYFRPSKEFVFCISEKYFKTFKRGKYENGGL